MDLKSSDRNFHGVIALLILMIGYGSLYPFDFRLVPGGIGPLHTLFGSWSKTPGRGDFISNILLYMPLGFCGGVTRGKQAKPRRAALIVLIGATLSFSVEYLQYYDNGRDTEATDFYANLLGTMLGAGCGWFFGRNFRMPLLRDIVANPVPVLLIIAWMGYRLYPYVPTTNLHKYWSALKPVILTPHVTVYFLFRQTTIWMILCVLIEKITGRERLARLFFLFALFIMAFSVLLIAGWLSVARIAGIGMGFWVWRAVSDRRRGPIFTAAALLCIYIVAQRLDPFRFSAIAGHFTWTPFLSFMRGSIDTDVQSFFEKFFLYGSLIWLLGQGGIGLRPASILVSFLLFATSWLEVFIPGRSAEITDALMALAIGALIHGIEATRYRPTVSDTLSRRIRPILPPDIAFDLPPDLMGEIRGGRRVDGF